jgi:hypothetical protein
LLARRYETNSRSSFDNLSPPGVFEFDVVSLGAIDPSVSGEDIGSPRLSFSSPVCRPAGKADVFWWFLMLKRYTASWLDERSL